MHHEGPELERLLHRLAECPAEFLRIGRGATDDGDAVAIICDQMRTMTPTDPPELSPLLAEIRVGSPARLKLLVIICWLLHDPWFLDRPNLAPAMWSLLASSQVTKLATLVKPEVFVTDVDRREELTRVCLGQLQLLPRGESAAVAADRLTTLDSVERDRVLRGTAVAEKRAREVREAMARARAQESASRYGE